PWYRHSVIAHMRVRRCLGASRKARSQAERTPVRDCKRHRDRFVPERLKVRRTCPPGARRYPCSATEMCVHRERAAGAAQLKGTPSLLEGGRRHEEGIS